MNAIPAHEPAYDTTFPEVGALVERYRNLWWTLPTTPSTASPSYSANEQLRRRRRCDGLIDELEASCNAYPSDGEDAEKWRLRLEGCLRRSADLFLDLPGPRPLGDDELRLTAEFISAASAFDPDLADADLFQALRNVWIMAFLQRILGRPVELTPAALAYSLLYPYTDNPLDDPSLDRRLKRRLCDRLGRRLAGHPLAAELPGEVRVFAMVERIEGQFPRGHFPAAWESVQAIHRAQVASLEQHGAAPSPHGLDLLGLSLAKGGTSVLADGYLVAGRLSPETADFCFGYGVVLQLLDDLQDVEADLAAGHWTLFSQTAHGGWSLDEPAARLDRLLDHLLDNGGALADPRRRPLRELVRRSCRLLWSTSIALNPRRFSRAFRRRSEVSSPFSFSYLRRRQRRVRRRYRRLRRRLARRHGRSVLEVLQAATMTADGPARFS